MATKMQSLVLGEFHTREDCLKALAGLRDTGFGDLELYSPYPVPEAYELLGIRWSPMPPLILGGALTGMLTGLALQLWCNGIDYPINIGGKPLFSIPPSIPITFELTILFGGLTAFFGLWAVLKLPRLHHPLFEVAQFGSSAIDRFWITIPTTPTELEIARARQALHSMGAGRVELIQPQPGDE
jgi:Protein of unknown function (DUF3341)